MPPRHDPAGLATLEWLLVIAAAGGFAAAMTIAFQNLLDDAPRTPPDPAGRLIDAGIDAARISSEAIAPQIIAETSADDTALAEAHAALATLERQCEDLASAYPDTLEAASWAWSTVPIDIPAPPPTTAPTTEPTPTTAPDETAPTTVTLAPGTETTLGTGDAPQTSGRWVCRISRPPR
ncbi:hypothetical protein [Candidatus Poriferisodalis sp.]|uniref:hypothetical protein n=1 Tax=Candidatus Poriferisodalis sp. TaxID=3101277 RepID=UPI003B029584